MNLLGKRILVIGLGRSGKAASLKLKQLGAKVRASDTSKRAEMVKLAGELERAGVEVKLGKQDESLLTGIDLVVVSPGVPSRAPVIKSARTLNIPVWGEIELAYRLTDKPIIAITGTNGKTTTTTLIGQVFESASIPAVVAGNIGMPLVSAIDDAGAEVLVVEVSSFQLDTIETFRPQVSVLLNITEDHLDWHPDFEDYIRAKSRLFINQRENDFAVLNLDDEITAALASNIKAKVVGTSKQELKLIKHGVFIKKGRIIARLNGCIEGFGKDVDVCSTDEIKIRGSHNLDNVMATVAASLLAGANVQSVREAITTFTGLKHRIEYVASVNEVDYYNDSKATNVDATVKALTAFSDPLVLLVGGRNKGNDFTLLAQSIGEQVKAVIGFGEAGREILNVMPAGTLQEYAETVDEAVVVASKLAQPKQVVLFSPACASFDAFTSYAQRGEVFKKAVLALGEKNGKREA